MSRPLRIVGWAVRGVLGILALYGLTSLPDLAARWGMTGAGGAVIAGWIAVAALGFTVLRARPTAAQFALLMTVLMTVRVAFGLLAAGRGSTGDPNSYLLLAKALYAGRGLVIFEAYFGSEWRALFPPVYPLLLAGWGAVAGFATPSLLALNTLTDAATAIALLLLGIRLGDATAGRRAAWLYLIWPSVLFSASLAQKESLCALLVVGLALAWVVRPAGWRGALALGLPAGLLTLTQPGEAPLAALFGLVLAARIGVWRMLAFGLRGAGIAVAVMLPWWVRNALIFHAFVPLTSAGGASLWIGNHAGATGNWEAPPPALRGLPEMVYGKRIGALATDWIAAHPAGFVRLTLTKFVRACGLGVFGVTRLEAMRPPLPLAFAAALWPLAQAAQVGLLGAGAVRALRVPAVLLLLIAACGLHLALFGMWFEFGERHREFATPLLLLALCWPGAQMVEKPAATP